MRLVITEIKSNGKSRVHEQLHAELNQATIYTIILLQSYIAFEDEDTNIKVYITYKDTNINNINDDSYF